MEAKAKGPVECLGLTFPDDEARREHFLGLLREKLKDPEFRKIEGFPQGGDENILTLSDPPHYTACPNPFLGDFIRHHGRPHDPNEPYGREPFAADVSEGKNDPIYNAHSYHTKVPHKAIMRYILHYTAPGDLVFDGFCGTGMTGVAAHMCGDKAEVESLGFRVDKAGSILRKEADENGRTIWKPFSKLGARRAVLNDLSPAAAFIAYNYNTPAEAAAFEREAESILKEVEEECGWMYETLHTDGKTKARINYTVWSDVFVCPECTREVIFWEAAVDKKAGRVRGEFPCPHCGAALTKRRMDRAWVTRYDGAIKRAIRQAKQEPVLVNYTAFGKRAEKSPDRGDLALIAKIENSDIPYWFPTARMMEGGETRRNDPFGLTHVHHFYTKRNLWILSALWNKASRKLKFGITNMLSRNATRLNRFIINKHNPAGRINGPMTGTLYVPSEQVEQSILQLFRDKLIRRGWPCRGNLVSTASLSDMPQAPGMSFDYLFFDPPFGANINYSELNSLWESWLGVLTNVKPEAIENDVQGKDLGEYRRLMTACFKEAYRVLKPGRWMTVEFSNTKASVWNSIQSGLADCGFIVSNVSVLDKQHGGIRAMSYSTAVKQDLVISAYKPDGGFEARFRKEAATEEGVWEFIRSHLAYLPVVKGGGGAARLIAAAERDPRILYDQMVAYYVRKGCSVPLNSADFQEWLSRRFPHRDGMYFLPEQAAEYDRRKSAAGGLEQVLIFVSDESSAITWLRRLIKDKPSPFQDIHPLFIKELAGWQKHEKPLELSELLEQNFLRYDGRGEVPSQIHGYLSTNFKELRNLAKDDEGLRAKGKDRWYVPAPNKAGDLEKLRERSLVKEFEDYRVCGLRRLKVFRLEAVRAGFKKAWQERDYAAIITVARKIPENILQEDPKLLMWYDQAVTRQGDVV